MKLKIFVPLTIVLVGTFFFPAFAQAQGKQPQLYRVFDFLVRPAMVSQFEAGIKKEMELGAPSPWVAYNTDDFHYYFLIPMKSFASIDSMQKADNEWIAKIGDASFQAILKSYEGTFEYYKEGVIRFLPELSYAPKPPRPKPEEDNFVYWGVCSVEFGKEKEFGDVFKQWIALYDTNKIPMGWKTYAGVMGMEMPLYFWAMRAKTAAEFWAEDERATKTIGEAKVMPLWNKTMTLCKKFEYKTGRPRPDLSNKPTAK